MDRKLKSLPNEYKKNFIYRLSCAHSSNHRILTLNIILLKPANIAFVVNVNKCFQLNLLAVPSRAELNANFEFVRFEINQNLCQVIIGINMPLSDTYSLFNQCSNHYYYLIQPHTHTLTHNQWILIGQRLSNDIHLNVSHSWNQVKMMRSNSVFVICIQMQTTWWNMIDLMELIHSNGRRPCWLGVSNANIKYSNIPYSICWAVWRKLKRI